MLEIPIYLEYLNHHGDWYVFSDIHGDSSYLMDCLYAIRVIDEYGNWTGRNSIVVLAGDMIDGYRSFSSTHTDERTHHARVDGEWISWKEELDLSDQESVLHPILRRVFQRMKEKSNMGKVTNPAWRGSAPHLLPDMTEETSILWYLNTLHLEAQRFGGSVLKLVGNHEWELFFRAEDVLEAQETDLDRSNKAVKRHAQDKFFGANDSFQWVSPYVYWNDPARMHRWNREQSNALDVQLMMFANTSTMANINGHIITHAGISEKLLIELSSLPATDLPTDLSHCKDVRTLLKCSHDVWTKWMRQGSNEFASSETLEKLLRAILIDPSSVVWTRDWGNILPDEWDSKSPRYKSFETILQRLDAKAMIIGHCITSSHTEQFGASLIKDPMTMIYQGHLLVPSAETSSDSSDFQSIRFGGPWVPCPLLAYNGGCQYMPLGIHASFHQKLYRVDAGSSRSFRPKGAPPLAQVLCFRWDSRKKQHFPEICYSTVHFDTFYEYPNWYTQILQFRPYKMACTWSNDYAVECNRVILLQYLLIQLEEMYSHRPRSGYTEPQQKMESFFRILFHIAYARHVLQPQPRYSSSVLQETCVSIGQGYNQLHKHKNSPLQRR